MSEWQSIATAPKDGEFLAFGSYLYPGDKHRTEYIMVAELNLDPGWPYSTAEGNHPKDFFSHWMPLPEAPK